MDFTTLGRTGLKVSVAGLGTGGFSRLGLATGGTEAQAAALIQQAIDLGVNFIDTAPVYGTEAIVGRALKSIPRQSIVLSTKIKRIGTTYTQAQVIDSLDNSLRLLGTDHVDVLHLHGVLPSQYRHVQDDIIPALLEQKAKGKFRYLGVTEQATEDYRHETMMKAAQDGVFDVVMVAFHMMHQSARRDVFPLTLKHKVGTLLMFAVRSMFAKPERVAAVMHDLAANGQVDKSLGETAEPLAFLTRDGGAATITEAAYRYVRHEPGVDVVMFGTGNAEHLRANIASILKPPLRAADRERLAALFGRLVDVGLDAHGHSRP